MQTRPVRTCVVCRLRRAQDEFLRIASTADGPHLDVRTRHEGRGAYVCPTQQCVEGLRVRDAKALRRALRLGPGTDLDHVLESVRNAVDAATPPPSGTRSAIKEQSE